MFWVCWTNKSVKIQCKKCSPQCSTSRPANLSSDRCRSSTSSLHSSRCLAAEWVDSGAGLRSASRAVRWNSASSTHPVLDPARWHCSSRAGRRRPMNSRPWCQTAAWLFLFACPVWVSSFCGSGERARDEEKREKWGENQLCVSLNLCWNLGLLVLLFFARSRWEKSTTTIEVNEKKTAWIVIVIKC